MPVLEVFVAVLCGVVLLLVVLLTAITQLNPDTDSIWRWVLESMRVTKREDVMARKPGRRARKTQRRRERENTLRVESPAAVTENATEPTNNLIGTGSSEIWSPVSTAESAFRLYEQHLSEDRESEKRMLRVQLQNMKARTLEFPCNGCGKVNAKKKCSYNCCAQCCRDNKNSVCRVHGTGYQAALAQVDAAMHYQFFEFDLSYAHLRKCPPNIPLIGPQLTSLNISNNRLSVLPEDIGNLYNLEELFLQYNCLTKLPESVCSLSQLVELDVKNNRLTVLPDCLGDLENLMVLSLTNNHIGHLPKSIGRLECLEELSLHSNHFTELPDEICNLKNLRIIYSGENHLQTLPSKFGQLLSLEELDISGCELLTLPDSLSHCKSLIRLWLSNNKLVSLPPHIGDLQQLKELHVRHNKLKFFPASIQQLHLYTFTAQNNCLIDEQTAKTLCKTPEGPLPPLLELAGRAVLRYELKWQPQDIPRYLNDMLLHPSHCSRCGGPFFKYFSSQMTFKTVGVFYRVPLYQQFCSPHANNQCV